MTQDIFTNEVIVLKRFFECYCNHDDKSNIDICYYDTKIDTISLCSECKEVFLYAQNRLQECNQSPKPKCRKCKNNCYNKDMYKKMAKIMAFGGVKSGVNRLKGLLAF